MLVVYTYKGVTTSKVVCTKCFNRLVANHTLTPSGATLNMVGSLNRANAGQYINPIPVSYRCECSTIVMVRR